MSCGKTRASDEEGALREVQSNGPDGCVSLLFSQNLVCHLELSSFPFLVFEIHMFLKSSR